MNSGIKAGLLATILVAGIAIPASAVSVRDESAINKLRSSAQSIDTQTGHLQELKNTQIEILDAIGTHEITDAYTKQFLENLQSEGGIKLGGGFGRLQQSRPLHERLTAPPQDEANQAESYKIPVYGFDASEAELANYASARRWAEDNFFAYRVEDLTESRKSSLQVEANRTAYLLDAALENWVISSLAQKAVSDATDIISIMTVNMENSESMRSELRASSIIALEQARMTAATNRILASQLELMSAQILASSPALLSDRRFNAISSLPPQ